MGLVRARVTSVFEKVTVVLIFRCIGNFKLRSNESVNLLNKKLCTGRYELLRC